MAIDVATLKTTLVADTRQFTSAIKKARSDTKRLQGETNKATRGGKGGGAGAGVGAGAMAARLGHPAVIAAGAAVGGLGLALKKAYGEADEATRAFRDTQAVIKSTHNASKVGAKGIADLANSLSVKIGVDDEVIQSSLNVLATFTQVRNEVGKSNQVFSRAGVVAADVAARMKTDLQSATLQLGKALNDPVRGMTALTRSGVSFTAQQKEQIKQLMESGQKLKAQKLILSEVETQFRGAAVAMAQPMDKAKVAIDNVFESLGMKFKPVVDSVATSIVKFIEQVKSGKGAGGAFAKTTTDIAKNLAAAWSAASPVISLAAKYIGSVIKATIGTIGAVVGSAVAGVRHFVEGVRALLTGDFAGVWKSLKSLVTSQLQGILSVLEAATAPIRMAAVALWGAIKTPFTATITAIKSAFTAVVRWIAGALGTALGTVSSIVGGLKSAFGWLPGIGGQFEGMKRGIDSAKRGLDAWKNSLGEADRRAAQVTGLKAQIEHLKEIRRQHQRNGASAKILAQDDSQLSAAQARLNETLRKGEPAGKTAARGVQALGGGAVNSAAAVTGAVTNIFDNVRSAMNALGISTKVPKFTAKAIKGAAPAGVGAFAQGGRIAGTGRRDTVPIMAAPGEVVLTRHQQRAVNQGATIPQALTDRRKHSQAFARGGIVGIPGMPGESIHSSILGDVLALIRRYKVLITDGYATSGHAPGGEHPKGLAVDIVPGAGGSWDLVDALARWAEPSQNNPRSPFRWVGYNGDANHGRGNHLHLSWGGGTFGGALGEPLGDIAKQSLRGNKGGLRDMGQAALDLVHKGAKSFVSGLFGASEGMEAGGAARGGSPKAIAKAMLSSYGWGGDQWGALETLWQHESGWNPKSVNPSSGATGIPQLNPSGGQTIPPNWSDPTTQIKWGMDYIKGRYGSPNAAWGFWQRNNWYQRGGYAGGAGYVGSPHKEPIVAMASKEKTKRGKALERHRKEQLKKMKRTPRVKSPGWARLGFEDSDKALGLWESVFDQEYSRVGDSYDRLSQVYDRSSEQILATDPSGNEFIDAAVRDQRLGELLSLKQFQESQVGGNLNKQALTGEQTLGMLDRFTAAANRQLHYWAQAQVREEAKVTRWMQQVKELKAKIEAKREWVKKEKKKKKPSGAGLKKAAKDIAHWQGQIGVLTGNIDKVKTWKSETVAPHMEAGRNAVATYQAQRASVSDALGYEIPQVRQFAKSQILASLDREIAEIHGMKPQTPSGELNDVGGGADLSAQLERERERARIAERTSKLSEAALSVFRGNFAGTFHTGGVIGGSGEKIAHVQGGEGIFTRDQMAAMGSDGGAGNVVVNIHGDAGVSALIQAVDVIVDGKIFSPSPQTQRRLADSVAAGLGYQSGRISPRARATA